MKKAFAKIIMAASAALSLIACGDDKFEQDYIYSSLLTARKDASGNMFFSMNPSRAFIATNPEYEKYKYTDRDEKRVIAYFSIPEDVNKTPLKIEGFDESYYIKVSQLDTVYIAPTVASTGNKADDAAKYGSGFIELVDNGGTPAVTTSDGYLNVFYRLYYGTAAKHSFSLVTGEDPDDPYTVHFRHNNGGDNDTVYSGDGLVCFSLKDLPDTHGETVKLTVIYEGYYGETYRKTTEYKTRTN